MSAYQLGWSSKKDSTNLPPHNILNKKETIKNYHNPKDGQDEKKVKEKQHQNKLSYGIYPWNGATLKP